MTIYNWVSTIIWNLKKKNIVIGRGVAVTGIGLQVRGDSNHNLNLPLAGNSILSPQMAQHNPIRQTMRSVLGEGGSI